MEIYLKHCKCGSICLHKRDRLDYFYIVCGLCGDVGTLEDSEDNAKIAWNEGKRIERRMVMFL